MLSVHLRIRFFFIYQYLHLIFLCALALCSLHVLQNKHDNAVMVVQSLAVSVQLLKLYHDQILFVMVHLLYSCVML